MCRRGDNPQNNFDTLRSINQFYQTPAPTLEVGGEFIYLSAAAKEPLNGKCLCLL